MKRQFRFVLLLALPAILLISLGFVYAMQVTAEPASPEAYTLPQRYEYSAKFLCGFSSLLPANPKQEDVVNGYYATVINIHNPNNQTIPIMKKVVLAYPETWPQSVPITPTKRFNDNIKSDHAMSVNCIEIVRLLELNGTPTQSQFIEGYVVIDVLPGKTGIALPQLDVDTVHTTSSGNPMVSSIETIHEGARLLPAGTWPY